MTWAPKDRRPAGLGKVLDRREAALLNAAKKYAAVYVNGGGVKYGTHHKPHEVALNNFRKECRNYYGKGQIRGQERPLAGGKEPNG